MARYLGAAARDPADGFARTLPQTAGRDHAVDAGRVAGAIAFLLLPIAPLPQVDFPAIVVQACRRGGVERQQVRLTRNIVDERHDVLDAVGRVGEAFHGRVRAFGLAPGLSRG
jgi:hypothetical protein